MQVLSDLNGPIEVKKYHPKMFVLDVSMEKPNLSANVDGRPITGMEMRLSANLKIQIYDHKLHY